MKRARRLAIVVMLLVAGPVAAQQSPQEKEVWSLEDTYWQCVQANDLERYAKLWSEDFSAGHTPTRNLRAKTKSRGGLLRTPAKAKSSSPSKLNP